MKLLVRRKVTTYIDVTIHIDSDEVTEEELKQYADGNDDYHWKDDEVEVSNTDVDFDSIEYLKNANGSIVTIEEYYTSKVLYKNN